MFGLHDITHFTNSGFNTLTIITLFSSYSNHRDSFPLSNFFPSPYPPKKGRTPCLCFTRRPLFSIRGSQSVLSPHFTYSPPVCSVKTYVPFGSASQRIKALHNLRNISCFANTGSVPLIISPKYSSHLHHCHRSPFPFLFVQMLCLPSHQQPVTS